LRQYVRLSSIRFTETIESETGDRVRHCTTKDIPVFELWNGRKSLITVRSNGQRNASETDEERSGEENETPRRPRRSKKSLAGHIIIFETEQEDGAVKEQAIWLQRKIGVKVLGGIIRLGCMLTKKTPPSSQSEDDDGDDEAFEAWELSVDEEGNPFFVKVVIMPSYVLHQANDDFSRGSKHNATNELIALQRIAANANANGNGDSGAGAGLTVETHVIGSSLIGTKDECVYAVLPHNPNGTLMQYTVSHGNLEEGVARFFFQQILKVSVYKRKAHPKKKFFLLPH